ncbi:integrase core domain-containing protein [Rhodopirellula europaea]|uniref:integrase core domain-containing protein n=1 Tax=Rhodopirellula europaea TaxID=1263866 RepID=UPI003D2E694B
MINEDDARTKARAWREDFNTRRPHSSLGYLTPTEFTLRSAASVRPTASLQQHCESPHPNFLTQSFISPGTENGGIPILSQSKRLFVPFFT